MIRRDHQETKTFETGELLQQWIERIETFLDIPRSEIGIIGNGKKRIGEKISVGIVNSVYPMAEEIREHIGHLVIDECHRTPSRTFTEAVTSFDCRYMLGLPTNISPDRADDAHIARAGARACARS